MERDHFDQLTRLIATTASRRAIFGLASALGLSPLFAEAKKRRKKKRKKCKGGTRKCGKRCIPATGCCRDSECGADERCEGDACVCALECCNDAACGTGNLCLAGACVTGQGTCPTGADICQGLSSDCGATGLGCTCVTKATGETRCASTTVSGSTCGDCAEDFACTNAYGPDAFCALGGPGACCPGGIDGICVRACPA